MPGLAKEGSIACFCFFRFFLLFCFHVFFFFVFSCIKKVFFLEEKTLPATRLLGENRSEALEICSQPIWQPVMGQLRVDGENGQ